MGLKDVYDTDNNVVVLDDLTGQSLVYRLNCNTGVIEKTYDSQSVNINQIACEPLNNSIGIYNANYTLKFINTDGNYVCETSVYLDSQFPIMPSIFDSSYWGYVYRLDGKHNLVNVKVLGLDKVEVKEGSMVLVLPVNGCVLMSERKPIVLTESGKKLIKLSVDGNTTEKSKALVVAYDLIDAHIVNNIIVIGKNDEYYIKVLNNLFTEEQDYIMPQQIVDIAVVQNLDDHYWVLSKSNDLLKVQCESGITTVISIFHIASLVPLTGVKHDYSDNGAIVYSDNVVYKISQDGLFLLWQNDNFEQIRDVLVLQDISSIYAEQFEYNLLSHKSMVFDGFRNKMWWITNGAESPIEKKMRGVDDDVKPKLCVMDGDHYSAEAKSVDLPYIPFGDQSSSSSTSSETSVSSGSSSSSSSISSQSSKSSKSSSTPSSESSVSLSSQSSTSSPSSLSSASSQSSQSSETSASSSSQSSESSISSSSESSMSSSSLSSETSKSTISSASSESTPSSKSSKSSLSSETSESSISNISSVSTQSSETSETSESSISNISSGSTQSSETSETSESTISNISSGSTQSSESSSLSSSSSVSSSSLSSSSSVSSSSLSSSSSVSSSGSSNSSSSTSTTSLSSSSPSSSSVSSSSTTISSISSSVTISASSVSSSVGEQDLVVTGNIAPESFKGTYEYIGYLGDWKQWWNNDAGGEGTGGAGIHCTDYEGYDRYYIQGYDDDWNTVMWGKDSPNYTDPEGTYSPIEHATGTATATRST